MRKFRTEDSNQLSAIKSNNYLERQIQTPKTPISPIILKHDIQSESAVQQDGKLTMQNLCHIFIQKYGSKINCEFQAKQLVKITGIKQRRIYDLMNILEGCNFVKRISKGTYIWYGFDQNQKLKEQNQYRKKDASSLSSLAVKVKDLLQNSQDYIDFKDICQKILSQNNDRKFNPNSIKRRVYQCCKILKIMGIIDKKDHTFKWISKQQRLKTQKKIIRQNIEKDEKYIITKQKQKNYDNSIKLDKYQLINQLIKEIKCSEQLNNLFQQIRSIHYQKIIKQQQIILNSKKLFSQY